PSIRIGVHSGVIMALSGRRSICQGLATRDESPFYACRRFALRSLGDAMQTSPDPEKAQAASCGIAVMAKASTPGASKTRLVPPLTPDEAARCNTAFLRDVADNIRAAAAQAPLAGYMAFGPPEARPFFEEILPREIGLIDAWYPSLGDCLL